MNKENMKFIPTFNKESAIKIDVSNVDRIEIDSLNDYVTVKVFKDDFEHSLTRPLGDLQSSMSIAKASARLLRDVVYSLVADVRKKKHEHAEAFCLMTYRCKDCDHTEMIYNNRDGVTPYHVTCTECHGLMNHVNYQDDIYDPDYVLQYGQRYFFTPTIEQHREQLKEMYIENKDYFLKQGRSEEDVITAILDATEQESRVQLGVNKDVNKITPRKYTCEQIINTIKNSNIELDIVDYLITESKTNEIVVWLADGETKIIHVDNFNELTITDISEEAIDLYYKREEISGRYPFNEELKLYIYTHDGKAMPGTTIVAAHSEREADKLVNKEVSKIESYGGGLVDGLGDSIELEEVVNISEAKIVYSWDGDY